MFKVGLLCAEVKKIERMSFHKLDLWKAYAKSFTEHLYGLIWNLISAQNPNYDGELVELLK